MTTTLKIQKKLIHKQGGFMYNYTVQKQKQSDKWEGEDVFWSGTGQRNIYIRQEMLQRNGKLHFLSFSALLN